jgi:DNA-binding response OmpR family regulator
MRVLVLAQNRMAGLGMADLAERCGYDAEMGTLPQVTAADPQGYDLVMLYGNAWDEDCRRAAAQVHARHIPLLIVIRGLEASTRLDLLRAGALAAFDASRPEELRYVLTSLLWSMTAPPDEFVLANGFVIDLNNRRVLRHDSEVRISLTECRVSSTLRAAAVTHGPQPVPLMALHRAVYGDIDRHSASTLRGHISHLRTKFEIDPQRPEVLCGRRKQGYWLRLADRSGPVAPADGAGRPHHPGRLS